MGELCRLKTCQAALYGTLIVILTKKGASEQRSNCEYENGSNATNGRVRTRPALNFLWRRKLLRGTSAVRPREHVPVHRGSGTGSTAGEETIPNLGSQAVIWFARFVRISQCFFVFTSDFCFMSFWKDEQRVVT